MTDTQTYPPLTVGTVLLTFATGTGMLLAALDANIVGTAMPTIVAQLGGLDLFSWVFSLYALVSTTAIPIFGRLSDVYGRKRLYLGGLAIFVLASILCGMSQSMPQLIVFRALQGVGGAAIFALVFAIVGDLHPPERRGQFQGAIASMWAISAVIGPGLGALITESIGWRWIFFVNVPVSLIPLLSLGFFLKEPTRDAGQARVDALGAGLLAGGVFALLNAMLMARQQGQQVQTLLLVVFSVTLIILFVRRQSKVQLPTIPLELFRRRMVTLGVIASLTFGWAAFSLPAFVPLLAQAVTGGTALNAGAALTPMVFGWSIMAAIAGPLVRPLGYRTLSLACFSLIGIGYLLLVRIDTSNSLNRFRNRDGDRRRRMRHRQSGSHAGVTELGRAPDARCRNQSGDVLPQLGQCHRHRRNGLVPNLALGVVSGRPRAGPISSSRRWQRRSRCRDCRDLPRISGVCDTGHLLSAPGVGRNRPRRLGDDDAVAKSNLGDRVGAGRGRRSTYFKFIWANWLTQIATF